MPDLVQLAQAIANGIVFGAILALCAIGLTLVYGILNLSNFAHGDFLSLGALMAFVFAGAWAGSLDVTLLGLGAALVAAAIVDHLLTHRLTPGERVTLAAAGGGTLVVGALLVAGVGRSGAQATPLVLLGATLASAAAVIVAQLVFEYGVWRRLRKRRATSLTLIIVSIGVALVVRNALLLQFGGGLHSFDRPGEVSPTYAGVRISSAELATVVIGLLIGVCVHLFLKLTRPGKAMRALADNPELARVSGVDVDRMVVYVWILSGVLLAVAGVLFALVRNNAMDAQMGSGILIALFAAVIVGGIGSAYGAMLGGLIIGVAMKTTILWIGSEYELAAAFLALIIVLIARPQGILGVKA